MTEFFCDYVILQSVTVFRSDNRITNWNFIYRIAVTATKTVIIKKNVSDERGLSLYSLFSRV